MQYVCASKLRRMAVRGILLFVLLLLSRELVVATPSSSPSMKKSNTQPNSLPKKGSGGSESTEQRADGDSEQQQQQGGTKNINALTGTIWETETSIAHAPPRRTQEDQIRQNARLLQQQLNTQKKAAHGEGNVHPNENNENQRIPPQDEQLKQLMKVLEKKQRDRKSWSGLIRDLALDVEEENTRDTETPTPPTHAAEERRLTDVDVERSTRKKILVLCKQIERIFRLTDVIFSGEEVLPLHDSKRDVNENGFPSSRWSARCDIQPLMRSPSSKPPFRQYLRATQIIREDQYVYLVQQRLPVLISTLDKELKALCASSDAPNESSRLTECRVGLEAIVSYRRGVQCIPSTLFTRFRQQRRDDAHHSSIDVHHALGKEHTDDRMLEQRWNLVGLAIQAFVFPHAIHSKPSSCDDDDSKIVPSSSLFPSTASFLLLSLGLIGTSFAVENITGAPHQQEAAVTRHHTITLADIELFWKSSFSLPKRSTHSHQREATSLGLYFLFISHGLRRRSNTVDQFAPRTYLYLLDSYAIHPSGGPAAATLATLFELGWFLVPYQDLVTTAKLHRNLLHNRRKENFRPQHGEGEEEERTSIRPEAVDAIPVEGKCPTNQRAGFSPSLLRFPFAAFSRVSTFATLMLAPKDLYGFDRIKNSPTYIEAQLDHLPQIEYSETSNLVQELDARLEAKEDPEDDGTVVDSDEQKESNGDENAMSPQAPSAKENLHRKSDIEERSFLERRGFLRNGAVERRLVSFAKSLPNDMVIHSLAKLYSMTILPFEHPNETMASYQGECLFLVALARTGFVPHEELRSSSSSSSRGFNSSYRAARHHCLAFQYALEEKSKDQTSSSLFHHPRDFLQKEFFASDGVSPLVEDFLVLFGNILKGQSDDNTVDGDELLSSASLSAPPQILRRLRALLRIQTYKSATDGLLGLTLIRLDGSIMISADVDDDPKSLLYETPVQKQQTRKQKDMFWSLLAGYSKRLSFLPFASLPSTLRIALNMSLTAVEVILTEVSEAKSELLPRQKSIMTELLAPLYLPFISYVHCGFPPRVGPLMARLKKTGDDVSPKMDVPVSEQMLLNTVMLFESQGLEPRRRGAVMPLSILEGIKRVRRHLLFNLAAVSHLSSEEMHAIVAWALFSAAGESSADTSFSACSHLLSQLDLDVDRLLLSEEEADRQSPSFQLSIQRVCYEEGLLHAVHSVTASIHTLDAHHGRTTSSTATQPGDDEEGEEGEGEHEPVVVVGEDTGGSPSNNPTDSSSSSILTDEETPSEEGLYVRGADNDDELPFLRVVPGNAMQEEEDEDTTEGGRMTRQGNHAPGGGQEEKEGGSSLNENPRGNDHHLHHQRGEGVESGDSSSLDSKKDLSPFRNFFKNMGKRSSVFDSDLTLARDLMDELRTAQTRLDRDFNPTSPLSQSSFLNLARCLETNCIDSFPSPLKNFSLSPRQLTLRGLIGQALLGSEGSSEGSKMQRALCDIAQLNGEGQTEEAYCGRSTVENMFKLPDALSRLQSLEYQDMGKEILKLYLSKSPFGFASVLQTESEDVERRCIDHCGSEHEPIVPPTIRANTTSKTSPLAQFDHHLDEESPMYSLTMGFRKAQLQLKTAFVLSSPETQDVLQHHLLLDDVSQWISEHPVYCCEHRSSGGGEGYPQSYLYRLGEFVRWLVISPLRRLVMLLVDTFEWCERAASSYQLATEKISTSPTEAFSMSFSENRWGFLYGPDADQWVLIEDGDTSEAHGTAETNNGLRARLLSVDEWVDDEHTHFAARTSSGLSKWIPVPFNTFQTLLKELVRRVAQPHQEEQDEDEGGSFRRAVTSQFAERNLAEQLILPHGLPHSLALDQNTFVREDIEEHSQQFVEEDLSGASAAGPIPKILRADSPRIMLNPLSFLSLHHFFVTGSSEALDALFIHIERDFLRRFGYLEEEGWWRRWSSSSSSCSLNTSSALHQQLPLFFLYTLSSATRQTFSVVEETFHFAHVVPLPSEVLSEAAGGGGTSMEHSNPNDLLHRSPPPSPWASLPRRWFTSASRGLTTISGAADVAPEQWWKSSPFIDRFGSNRLEPFVRSSLIMHKLASHYVLDYDGRYAWNCAGLDFSSQFWKTHHHSDEVSEQESMRNVGRAEEGKEGDATRSNIYHYRRAFGGDTDVWTSPLCLLHLATSSAHSNSSAGGVMIDTHHTRRHALRFAQLQLRQLGRFHQNGDYFEDLKKSGSSSPWSWIVEMLSPTATNFSAFSVHHRPEETLVSVSTGTSSGAMNNPQQNVNRPMADDDGEENIQTPPPPPPSGTGKEAEHQLRFHLRPAPRGTFERNMEWSPFHRSSSRREEEEEDRNATREDKNDEEDEEEDPSDSTVLDELKIGLTYGRGHSWTAKRLWNLKAQEFSLELALLWETLKSLL